MIEDKRKKIEQDHNESSLKQQVSELETLIFKYRQLEKTLRDALRKEYDDREKHIMKQTDNLMAANRKLKKEIIERKKAEEASHYREEFVRLITTLSTNFIRLAPEKTQGAINEALETIGKFVDVDRSYAFLFNDSDNGVSIEDFFEWCAPNIKPQIRYLKGHRLDKELPWFAKKIRRHGIFHISCCDELPIEASAEKDYFLAHSIKSFVAVPMFCKRSFIGFVGFDSVQKEKTWTVDIIALLRIVGEIFATTLERKKVEIDLRESEKKYKLLFECNSDGIAVLDIKSNIIDCNNAFTDILGFSFREIEGKQISNFFIEESKKKGILNNINKDREAEFELEIIRKDKKVISVWCKATAIFEESSKFKGIIIHFRQISKRKDTEDTLLKTHPEMKKKIIKSDETLISYNKACIDHEIAECKHTDNETRLAYEDLNNIFNTTVNGIGVIDKDFNILQINKTLSKLIGVNKEDSIKKKCFELFPSALCHTENCPIFCILNGQDRVERRIEIKNKDGFNIFCILTASPFRGHNNKLIGIIEDFKDITEYKKTQDNLLHELLKKRGTTFNAAGRFINNREELEKKRFIDVRKEEMDIEEEVLNLFDTSELSLDKEYTINLKSADDLGKKIDKLDNKIDYKDFAILKEVSKKKADTFCFEGIHGSSKCMKELFHILPTVAASVSTVLIQGESGTGKHLFAKAIHNLSPRRDKPFIILNCGAFPDTLLESELFGYKAGAFTDAKKDKLGRFALANGGTLFLDEIGDISPAMQVRLLRFLQERVYEPLGSVKSMKVDVRIIAATNKNLMDLVLDGKFRQDLFYRINVVKLDLPPLRERLCDIPILINCFIEQLNSRQNKKIIGVSEEVLACLISYDYPGNIRELENIIERAFVLCQSGKIEKKYLPEHITSSYNNYSEGKGLSSLMKIETAFLMNILRQNNWNRLKTARQLGIHRTTLFRKIKSLGLKVPPSFKKSNP